MCKQAIGFSKRSKEEKIDWLLDNHFIQKETTKELLKSYWHSDKEIQQKHDDFIENTISNFYLPLGVAPNFLINDKLYTLPFAIEESSVVASAAKTAKYWKDKGGFKTTVINTEKTGQVHFFFNGKKASLVRFIEEIKPYFFSETKSITKNMVSRGGGILNLELIDKTKELKNYYQLHASFNTIDSMGANFINSCLEQFAKTLVEKAQNHAQFSSEERKITILMSILSNNVPSCIVKAKVSCPIDSLEEEEGMSKLQFAEKFIQTVTIATIDPYRAVTHNKGIMNGVDALVLATGNDFRAVEAGVHAYASKSGQYRSLSKAYIEKETFNFELEIPLAIGTIGGLTSLHPLAKWSLKLLGNPSAKELMEVIATAGLAQNFAAIRALITSGIQRGHMRMHLQNILNQLNVSHSQKEKAIQHFSNKVISFQSVSEFIQKNEI